MRNVDLPSINWFDESQQLLVTHFPETRPWISQLVKRLTLLLLSRLPEILQKKIIELLPPTVIQNHALTLEEVLEISENDTIGYADFIEDVAGTLEVDLIVSEYDLFDRSRKIADFFLWVIARKFPSELKNELTLHLPSEIRLRMDLNSASTDSAKVA